MSDSGSARTLEREISRLTTEYRTVMTFPHWLSLVKEVPDFHAVPTFNHMAQRTQETQHRYPDLVTVTRADLSGQGEPIDLISIGDGPLSALFIGAPHPNEPIGCLLIDYLIDRLCRDPALRQSLPYRWHFIKAIEPDALRLNEGRFSAYGDLGVYLKHLYRPPFAEQAEYTFPFEPDDRLARYPLPENLAWRAAIELAKPDFMYSLHNAEFGGVFHLALAMPAELAATLAGVSGQYGLTLNSVGEAALGRWADGIFQFRDMEKERMRAQEAAALVQPGERPLGNSSGGYTASRGTFSFVTEVPFWDHARLHDDGRSNRSLGELEADLRAWSMDIFPLARRALSLDYAATNAAALSIWRGLREFIGNYEKDFSPTMSESEQQRTLTWAEYTIRHVTGRLFLLRLVALARRLSMLALDRGEGFRVSAACSDFLSREIDRLTHSDHLQPIPLRTLVQIQLHAGLSVLTHLAAPRAG